MNNHLKSVGAKRLLYLSENHLSAWLWRGSELSCSGIFKPDETGLAHFGAYLAQLPNIPISMLVDIMEEKFHNETIPHVFGTDRQALIGRKLNQFFPITSYRHARTQGRETDGRRDDKLLLTGLTDDSRIGPWIEHILRLKQPLAGIWSLPLLSQVLVKKLGVPAPHQLLLTRQTAGLRQSYFQQGQIKFSRLIRLSADHLANMPETLSHETVRIQQYLNSLHLLPTDAMLDITVCDASRLPQVQSPDTPLLRHRVFSREEIAGKLGLNTAAVDLSNEMLHLHLLGQSKTPQHYAGGRQLWYRRLQQVRTGIFSVTALLAAVTVYVAGQNLNQALDDYLESEKISHSTQDYFSQYQSVKNTFPPTPATPENMKSAVELMQAVYDKDVTPEHLMRLVSQALESSGSVRLDRIKWQVSDTPDEALPPPPISIQPAADDIVENRIPPPAPVPTPVPAITIHAGKHYQIAILDGEIAPFNHYRSALDDVNRFLETLNKNPSLRATALVMPIDISTSANLQGSMGAVEKAVFSLKLVLEPVP